jgi:predicted hotdog family 3-hydroxylacyl-ACP dehydratase
MKDSLPATLDHAGIAARVPHHGTMCLLDSLLGWADDKLSCTAVSHRDPANPLRSASGLLSAHAIEYAAQAMALHGALRAEAAGAAAGPVPGYLASARGVQLARWRMDDVTGDLRIEAERIAGDVRQLLYSFRITDAEGTCLAEGRATVVLNTPLRPAGTSP